MDLAMLKKINSSNIQAAGPRYSPIVDPGAPNLEIAPLVSTIEAIALTEKYRASIGDLEKDLSESWNQSSKATVALFTSLSPKDLLSLLGVLKKEKPGKSKTTLKLLEKRTGEISSILKKREY